MIEDFENLLKDTVSFSNKNAEKKSTLCSVFSSYYDGLPRTSKLAGFNVPHPRRELHYTLFHSLHASFLQQEVSQFVLPNLSLASRRINMQIAFNYVLGTEQGDNFRKWHWRVSYRNNFKITLVARLRNSSNARKRCQRGCLSSRENWDIPF